METIKSTKLRLEGLNCAHCATKIEAKVGAMEGVSVAQIDFVQQLLTIEVTGTSSHKLVEEATKIIQDIEPHLKVHNFDNPLHVEKHWIRNALKTVHFQTFLLGCLFFIIALFMHESNPLRLWTYLFSYFLIGGEILYLAFRNIIKGQVFDENFLMSLATIGAFSIGQYPEGVAVMFFYRIGEFFQDLAVERSRKSITALMDIRPDFANLQTQSGEQRVAPQEVKVGSHIIVRPGEKIPLDGIVFEGKSTLDTSALSGEAIPKEVGKGDEILSGTINQRGVLIIETTKIFAESTVSKILDLVQNASGKKAKTEQFITTFAKYYTPLVVISALLLAFVPPLLWKDALLSEWFGRALVFLVVSCPCALIVSIPLSFFGGIGGASKNGILVKGGNFLEALNSVDTVIFDKTGTLTKGIFSVTMTQGLNGYSEVDVLRLAVMAEQHSNHPIALSIKKEWKQPLVNDNFDYEELAGYGVKATIDEKRVFVGSAKLLSEHHIAFESITTPDTVVYVAVDNVLAGYLLIADEPKDDSILAIEHLKSLGIRHLIMLTGDSLGAAQKIADKVGISTIFAHLLPHQKVEKLEEIMANKKGKGKTVFVGDGINDAPVLARCDIGIAMGGVGSDAAIEAADIVIMTDEISKVATAITIARKTHQIVWQNIIFALGVKGVILVMGAFGIATMWEAVFGDVGVALIAVLNATRVLNIKTA